MAHANVEMVRQAFERFARGEDPDPDAFDPAFEFDNSDGVIDPAVYHGPEGLDEYRSAMDAMWGEVRFEALEFFAAGDDTVVMAMRLHAVGADGTRATENRTVVFRIRAGRFAHAKAFQNRAAALEAAGVRE